MFVVLISIVFSLSSSYAADSVVGTVSSLYAVKNCRPNMEDYSVRIENVYGTGFYAILDGHLGNYSASYGKKFLTRAFVNELKLNHSNHGNSKYAEGPNGDLNLSNMLTDFTAQIEAHLEAKRSEHNSGSTCLMIVAEKDKLTVGNVGDSRGVMCDSKFEAIDLSIDHKAGRNDNEETRILEANENLRNRLQGRIYGLALTRALGDWETKMLAGENVIISTPEIFQFDLNEHKPKFMILASDGLWDKVTSQVAVDFIKDHLEDNDFGAKALAKKAINANSQDNITVMVVVFKNGTYEASTGCLGKIGNLICCKSGNCFKN